MLLKHFIIRTEWCKFSFKSGNLNYDHAQTHMQEEEEEVEEVPIHAVPPPG